MLLDRLAGNTERDGSGPRSSSCDLVSHRPKNLVGWILCGIGLLFEIGAFASAYADYALFARSGSVPGGILMLWVTEWVGLWVFPSAVLLVLLFPHGRLLAHGWRAVVWAALAGGALCSLLTYAPLRNLTKGVYLGESASSSCVPPPPSLRMREKSPAPFSLTPMLKHGDESAMNFAAYTTILKGHLTRFQQLWP